MRDYSIAKDIERLGEILARITEIMNRYEPEADQWERPDMEDQGLPPAAGQ